MVVGSLRKLIGLAVARLRVDGQARPAPRMPVSDVSVVKLDRIGDFVLSTAFLRILAKQLPDANVHLFCRKPVGILARSQFPRWQVSELPARTKPLANILSELRLRGWLGRLKPTDLLIDLRGYRDISDSAVASWIPSRHKLALANCFPDQLRWVVMPREDLIYDSLFASSTAPEPGVPREIANYRALAASLFPDSPEAPIALPVLRADENDVAEVHSLLNSEFGVDASRPFLLVAPASAGAIKQYPVEMLAAALRATLAAKPMPVVITGSAEDAQVITRLAECLRGDKNIHSSAGGFNLIQHVALVSLAAATLSMDSASAHIAGALGVPALVLLGGGHYGHFAPWGESSSFRWLTNRLPCFGCNWQCIYECPLCLHDIPPGDIAWNLVQLLK